jgi:hypothetical protein
MQLNSNYVAALLVTVAFLATSDVRADNFFLSPGKHKNIFPKPMNERVVAKAVAKANARRSQLTKQRSVPSIHDRYQAAALAMVQHYRTTPMLPPVIYPTRGR